MRVRHERAQKAEITGTRRAESPRRSRCTTSQGARPEDARQIGLIRARSRSLMNNAGYAAAAAPIPRIMTRSVPCKRVVPPGRLPLWKTDSLARGGDDRDS